MVDRRGTDLLDLLAFFIGLSLTATGGASANDANDVAALDVGDDYKMLPKGLPNQEEVLLVDGVVWVRNRDGERIREGRGGLRKTDGVLPKVGGCFARIPGEPERHSSIYRAPRHGIRLTPQFSCGRSPQYAH